MVRPTHDEILRDLSKEVAVLQERLRATVQQLDTLNATHRELAREHADLRRAYERESSLHAWEIEEFKKWKDAQQKEREERSRRLWSFGPNIVGALVNGLIAAAVAYFISRR